MDLEDALTLGNLHAGVSPRRVVLPYIAPALNAMGWQMRTGYTTPAANSADVEFGPGSIVPYAWAWYDDLPYALRTGYSAPAATAADVAFETR